MRATLTLVLLSSICCARHGVEPLIRGEVQMMVCGQQAPVLPHPPVAQTGGGIMLGLHAGHLVSCDLGDGSCWPAGGGDGSIDEACQGYWDDDKRRR